MGAPKRVKHTFERQVPTAFCLRDHHPLPAARQPADMHIIVNTSALSSTVRAARTLLNSELDGPRRKSSGR